MSIARTNPRAPSGFPEPLFPLPTHEDLPCNEAEAKNWPIKFRPLPTHDELPETDGKPVENTYQHPQSTLLTSTLTPILDRFHPDGDYLIGTGTAVYWMATKDPFEGCKAPDWYYIPNVPRLRNGKFRRSYVLWEEHVNPLLVVEYVSGNGAEERDDTPGWGKFWVYERAIAAGYYVIWDTPRKKLEVYELHRGRYRPVDADASGRFRLAEMEIDVGIWEGSYLGNTARWLRAWDLTGNLIPTPEEQREAETRRADAEKDRADKLAAKLRELGVDPNQL
jgi:Uma2 family endonuclease